MKVLLTEGQVHQLLEALHGHPLEAIMTLAFVTGAWRNELLNLKWRQIDLEHRNMHVLNANSKSHFRLIPLSEQVTELLKQHRLRQREAQERAGTAWFDRDLVFSNEIGGFLGTGELVQGWHEILEQAGLPPLQLHSLRVALWRALRGQEHMAQEKHEGTQMEEPSLGEHNDPS